MNLFTNRAISRNPVQAIELIQVPAAVIAIALLSQVVIPMKPVPFTGQTLGILLTSGLLGRQKGILAVFTYILFGTMGMPFFAGGDFGLARLAGPTGGYLAGFVASAYLVGYLSDKGLFKTFSSAVVCMTAGNLVIYALGVIWLSGFTGWENVMNAGVIPFIPGDIIKIIIAASLVPSASKLIR
jgi:biotin transporter BioY